MFIDFLSAPCNGCGHKCQNGNDQPIHENIIRYPQQFVFSAQYHALGIHIPNERAIQEVAVLHHLAHARRIIFQFHLIKIAKKKQIHFLLVKVLAGKYAGQQVRPRGQYGEDDREHANCKNQVGRPGQVAVFFQLSQ